MKKSSLLAIVILGFMAYSCNIAKTCPTYAKAPKVSVEKQSRR